MKKIKKSQLGKMLIFFVILSFIFTFMYLIILNMQEKLPNNLEYHRKNGKATLTTEEIDMLRNIQPDYDVTYYTVKLGNLTTKTQTSRDIALFHTDMYYKNQYPLEMMYGNFFADGTRSIVISEEISNELFMTYNSVGYLVNLNGIDYNIVGVYKSDTTYMDKAYGAKIAYLPFGDNKTIDTFSINSTNDSEFFKRIFPLNITSKLDGYEGITLQNEVNIAILISKIIILTLFFCILYFYYRYCKIAVIGYINKLKYDYTNNYGKKVFFKNFFKSVKMMLLLLGLVAIAAVFVIIIFKPISLTIQNVDFNLFDVGFYLDIVANLNGRLNTYANILNTYFIQYINQGIYVIITLMLLAQIFIVSFFVYLRKILL